MTILGFRPGGPVLPATRHEFRARFRSRRSPVSLANGTPDLVAVRGGARPARAARGRRGLGDEAGQCRGVVPGQSRVRPLTKCWTARRPHPPGARLDVRHRHVTVESLRRAIAIIANGTLQARHPATWDHGTRVCASESKHCGALSATQPERAPIPTRSFPKPI